MNCFSNVFCLIKHAWLKNENEIEKAKADIKYIIKILTNYSQVKDKMKNIVINAQSSINVVLHNITSKTVQYIYI